MDRFSELAIYSRGLARREQTPPWLWAGMVLIALLLNGLTLVGASDALVSVLAVDAEAVAVDVVEFEFVEPERDSEQLVRNDAAEGEVPDDATRIAEVDVDVEHETRARTQPAALPSPASAPSPTHRAPPRVTSPSERAEAEAVGASGQMLHDASDGEAAHDTPARDRGTSQAAPARTHAHSPDLAPLGGSTRMLRASFGTHGNPDDLRELDEDTLARLDTREHHYASFFNRLRSRVLQYWDPQAAHDAVDPHHSRFGTKPRTTTLWIQLDATGAITKLAVARDSGTDHLDEEAIRAVNAAGPFPNPPDGLIDATGHIDFLVGFTYDLSEGTQQVFREHE
jgi:TonB family protein